MNYWWINRGRDKLFLTYKLFLAAALGTAAWAQTAQPKPLSEWQIVQSLDPAYLREYETAGRPDSKGAIGHNRDSFKNAGNQRHSIETILWGTLNRDVKETEKGISVMEFTFAHQKPDGDFEYAIEDPHYHGSIAEHAQTAAFFFYDLGHAILYLDENPWFRESAETAGLRTRLERVKTQAAQSLRWLKLQEKWLRKDTKAANRVIIYGEAYYLIGRVAGDPEAMKLGRSLLNVALGMQSPEGYLIENGGGDTNYNLFSALLLENLYLYLDPEDAGQKARIWNAIARAAQWEMTRVRDDGEVLTEGNSRVKPGGETYLGREKAVDTLRLPLMLYYYAALSGDGHAKAMADRVQAKYLIRR